MMQPSRMRWSTNSAQSLFVKPANQGSSVGISKVESREGLLPALLDAARYDTKILVERAIDAREIEVALLGNDPIEASIPGEIRTRHAFYDYEAKYIDDETELLIPAPIDDELAEEIRHLAMEAVVALEGAGLARVDFLLDRNSGEVFINEVNSIPGFTQGSMYPLLWQASGIPYPALLDRLIELALERHRSLLSAGDPLRTHAVAERPELIEPQLVDLDCRTLDSPRRFGIIQVAIDLLEHRLQLWRTFLGAIRRLPGIGTRVVELDRVRVIDLHDQARVAAGQRHQFPRFGAASPMLIEMRDHGSRQICWCALG